MIGAVRLLHPYVLVACRGIVNKGKGWRYNSMPFPIRYGTYVRLMDKFAPVLITQEV
jgi:hypothetical protein